MAVILYSTWLAHESYNTVAPLGDVVPSTMPRLMSGQREADLLGERRVADAGCPFFYRARLVNEVSALRPQIHPNKPIVASPHQHDGQGNSSGIPSQQRNKAPDRMTPGFDIDQECRWL
jgi:hypothetical protein